MMAAAKKGCLKKKRSDPTRSRRPDPPPSPPETRRSLRPRQTRYLADFEDELDLEEEEREAKERRKLKLVLKLQSISSTGRCRDSSPVTAPKSRRVEPDRHVDCSPPLDYSPPSTSRSATSSSSSSEDEEEEEIVKPLKKRRIDRVRDLDGSGHREESKRSEVRRPIRAVSGTPMPGRNELEAILDRLQKKDTYGVFAEPVDPEELPDYRDVIEHPMDFGTVRRKLSSGRYRSFEQFEDDVFLICSNAMQYNAPDTVYFRQARSIQDMARKSFQEIRADLISRGAERKSEENFRSLSNEKSTEKRPQCGVAPRPSGFSVSSLEKKTLRQPCRNALEPLGRDVSSMENKILKKQCKTAPEPPGSDVSYIEKKTLKKPQYGTAPEPRDSDISSIERKTLEKPQYRTAPEPPSSDIYSTEKKTLKKPQCRTVSESRGSDVSSMENKTAKKPIYRTAPEPTGSDISSMEKKTVNKPQNRTTPEPLGSGISSMEKTTLKKLWIRNEPEPICSDISSQDKKTQKEHQTRTAPEPLGSDISSGATLASAADTFIGSSKIPDNGNGSTTGPCTGFSTVQAVQASGSDWAADTCIGLTTVKTNCAERSVTINGSADGSSLGESKPERADEVPAKGSPSKLGLKPFVVDVNRRATYNTFEEHQVVEKDAVFDVFEGEKRDLVVVGLNSEYAYARSLARFAGSLGPIAWEIASKKIEQALPPGVKFGCGWVGEYEPLLTPVLSLENSTRLQVTVTRKDKGNEFKSEATSSVPRKDKGNKMMSEVIRNGQCKDMSFGFSSQMATGMPSNVASNPSNVGGERTQEQKRGLFSGMPANVASNPSNEGGERTQEQKRGLFGVNIELQPHTSRTTVEKQKNPPAADLPKAYTKETSGNRLEISSEVAKSTSPAIVSTGWNPVQSEAQKLQQQKNQVAQVWTEPQKQQPRTQVTSDFGKAFTNETTKSRPELYSETRPSNFSASSYMGWSQMQTEPLKQPEEVASHRRNDGLSMNVGGLSNWSSCDSRQNAPFGIISNQQAGVQYWFARGNQDQAVNDPLRWMSSSGNICKQQNTSNKTGNNLERSMPTVKIPKRENPIPAAAQAWMSIGAERKPVDGGCLPNKQAGSASFSPTWKTPRPASRVHEESIVKAEPFQGIIENTQAQTKGLVIFPQLMTADLSRLRSPWQGLVQHNKQKDTLPPDLNISFQPPASPPRSSSGILIDSQQPDLALQL